jgi:hypothetical protein
MIDRWCCTNGNCISCMHNSHDERGVRLRTRMVQYLTFHDGQAAKVVKNWSAYGAEAELATAQEIAKLEGGKQVVGQPDAEAPEQPNAGQAHLGE